MFRATSAIIFIFFLGCGIITISNFLFEISFNDSILEANIMLGWLLTIISFFSYLIATVLWSLFKSDWYWESFYPISFSLVLWVVALFGYNKDLGFTGGMIFLFLSFPTAMLISYFNFHKARFYFLILFVCFLPHINYLVPFFMGCVLFILSIMELLKINRWRNQIKESMGRINGSGKSMGSDSIDLN